MIPLQLVALRKESVDRNSAGRESDTEEKRSLSARRAWIEIRGARPIGCKCPSLSARRAWIEICNINIHSYFLQSLSARRAWIEISVVRYKPTPKPSLSARRAWIEMWVLRKVPLLGIVALRKESVDRNDRFQVAVHFVTLSLSARRAWIEI